MSAFIVSKQHIDAIVTAIGDDTHLQRLTDYDGEGTFQNYIGRILWRENIVSVKHRYPQDDTPLELADTYRFVPLDQPAVTVMKLINCLDYQSCEHDEWEASTAKQILERTYRILTYKLPGYDDAPWGI